MGMKPLLSQKTQQILYEIHVIMWLTFNHSVKPQGKSAQPANYSTKA